MDLRSVVSNRSPSAEPKSLTAFEDVDLSAGRPIGTKHLFPERISDLPTSSWSTQTHPKCRPSAATVRRARKVGNDQSPDVKVGVRSDANTIPESSSCEPGRIVDCDDGLSGRVDVREAVRCCRGSVDVPVAIGELEKET